MRCGIYRDNPITGNSNTQHRLCYIVDFYYYCIYQEVTTFSQQSWNFQNVARLVLRCCSGFEVAQYFQGDIPEKLVQNIDDTMAVAVISFSKFWMV